MKLARSIQSAELAIHGGQPLRSAPWPKWPRADTATENNVLDVLHSGRWAISGQYNGSTLYERRFAEKFAALHDVPYCVTTVNGSAALTISLEALGVDYGAEVLVPGITWVACASSVAGIGVIPVLVDVEPETLCMSVEAARRAITPRTAAILLVHLYCTVADLEGFIALSHETGIPLIEDCSQAHGAIWRGRRVGTFGSLGTFSMQDSKVLTCGEGGAVITRDPRLYDRLQQLRTDGRRYPTKPVARECQELEEIGEIQGHNYCLSEVQSAILLDRIQHLDAENAVRERNANYLRHRVQGLRGIRCVAVRQGTDSATYYQFCFQTDPENAAGTCEWVCRALSAELKLGFEPIDPPLNNNILYNPTRSPRTSPELRPLLDPKRYELPVATQAARRCFTFHHHALMGSQQDMDEIVAALEKVGFAR